MSNLSNNLCFLFAHTSDNGESACCLSQVETRVKSKQHGDWH